MACLKLSAYNEAGMKQGISVVEITTEANKEVGSRKVLVKSVFGSKIKSRITNTYHESQKI